MTIITPEIGTTWHCATVAWPVGKQYSQWTIYQRIAFTSGDEMEVSSKSKLL